MEKDRVPFKGLETVYDQFKDNRDRFAQEHGLGDTYTHEDLIKKAEEIKVVMMIDRWEKAGIIEKGQLALERERAVRGEITEDEIDIVFETINRLEGEKKENARAIAKGVYEEIDTPLNIGFGAIR